MIKFSSKPVDVQMSAEAFTDKFADLSKFQQTIDSLPEEQRAKLGNVATTADSIILKTPQVGDITLKVVERTPALVRFEAIGSPVPMQLDVNIAAEEADKCKVETSMGVEIPPFMKSMVGGALQKAVDQFGNFIAQMA